MRPPSDQLGVFQLRVLQLGVLRGRLAILAMIWLCASPIYAQSVLEEYVIDDEVCSWAVEPTASRVFASIANRGEIVEFDKQSGRPVRKFPLSTFASQIIAENRILVCSHGPSPAITLIDLTSNEVLRRIRIDDLRSPIQLHGFRNDSKFAIVSGLNKQQQTVFVRLNLKAARIEDQVVIDQVIVDRALSSFGDILIGRDSNSQLSMFEISFDKLQATFLRSLAVDVDSISQSNGLYFSLGNASTGSKSETSKVPDGFRLVGFDQTNDLLAAVRQVEGKTAEFYVADRLASTSKPIRIELDEFESLESTAQFFSSSGQRHVAIGSKNKLVVLDASAVRDNIGQHIISPLRTGYRIELGSLFRADLNYTDIESSATNVWDLESAPTGITVQGNELMVAGEMELGSYPLKLQAKSGSQSRDFETIIQVVYPEIEIGFVPIASDTSIDRKQVVMTGRTKKGKSELVVADLSRREIVQRIELKMEAKDCWFGRKYVYVLDDDAKEMEIYSREKLTLAKRRSSTEKVYGFFPLADGRIIYCTGVSSTKVTYRWCTEDEFVEQNEQAHLKLDIPAVYAISEGTTFVDQDKTLFETRNGYHAGSISFQDGNYFLHERMGFKELHSAPKTEARSYRWNVPISDGALFDATNQRDAIYQIPESDSNSIVEFPVAWGTDIEVRKDKATGVLRDLVKFDELYRVTLFDGEIPVWYREHVARVAELKSQLTPDRPAMSSRQSAEQKKTIGKAKSQLFKLSPPIRLLRTTTESLAILCGSKLIFTPALNLDAAEFSKPLQLETTQIIPGNFEQPIKFRCLPEFGVGEVNVKLLNATSATVFDETRNELSIEPRLVWDDYRTRELEKIKLENRGAYTPSKYRKNPESIELFKQLYGREPTGVPCVLSLGIQAQDTRGSIATIYRSVVIEVPEANYNRLVADFNSGLSQHKTSEQKRLMKAIAGEFGNEVDRFVTKIGQEYQKLERYMPSDESRNELKSAEAKIRQLTIEYQHSLKEQAMAIESFSSRSAQLDDFKSMRKLRDREVAYKDQLRRSISTGKYWLGGLFTFASLFFLSSLVLLYRSRSASTQITES